MYEVRPDLRFRFRGAYRWRSTCARYSPGVRKNARAVEIEHRQGKNRLRSFSYVRSRELRCAERVCARAKGFLSRRAQLQPKRTLIFVFLYLPVCSASNKDRIARHLHKRATVDPRKTTCMLYLQADHQFFARYGTEEACIEVMTRHVQRVNSIYKHTGECSSPPS